jgi:hypothetical protein
MKDVPGEAGSIVAVGTMVGGGDAGSFGAVTSIGSLGGIIDMMTR